MKDKGGFADNSSVMTTINDDKITIVLADDHQVVRQGLRVLLENEPDCTVVGEATSGLEVADMVEQTKPRVLVLDLMMPGLNGVEVTRQVAKRSPETSIVILSMHANEAYVLEAFRNGASGYVLKDGAASDLVEAVHSVLDGKRYLCPSLSERAVQAYIEKVEGGNTDPYDTLTKRERQVLQLAAEGCSNADMAEKMQISPRTVEVHRSNLIRKLGLRNQTDLIRYALKRGVIPIEN